MGSNTSSVRLCLQQGLRLCLEPEVAGVYSVEFYRRKFSGSWEVGKEVLILDCGGGTIDVTSHRVISTGPLKLEEVTTPVGGPWGSAECVDANFKDCLKVRMNIALTACRPSVVPLILFLSMCHLFFELEEVSFIKCLVTCFSTLRRFLSS